MPLIEIPWRPPNSTLRWFAVICTLVLIGLGSWITDETIGISLVVIGLVLGALGISLPQSIRPLFVGSIILTYPIGWVISFVLLLFVYYCLFTPLGLFFRLIGRDALTRRLEPVRESYWASKPAPAGTASYFYQS